MTGKIHTSGHVQLVPITESLLPVVRAAAAADHHPLIVPTHAALRDGEVIGYCSAGAVPVVFAWLSRLTSTPRASYEAWQRMEYLVRHPLRPRTICLPCEETSPFAPLLERQGYHILGKALFAIKTLEAKGK